MGTREQSRFSGAILKIFYKYNKSISNKRANTFKKYWEHFLHSSKVLCGRNAKLNRKDNPHWPFFHLYLNLRFDFMKAVYRLFETPSYMYNLRN